MFSRSRDDAPEKARSSLGVIAWSTAAGEYPLGLAIKEAQRRHRSRKGQFRKHPERPKPN
jgi:hypothetical protein